MKYAAFILMALIACNEPNNSSSVAGDTMPTVKPEVKDTSRVITTSPTGDSNIVKPDSSVKSK
jgi:hypothetical protein